MVLRDGNGTTTFSYTGSGSGVIPDSHAAPWRAVKDDTVFLRIEDGITRIGNNAFTDSVFLRAKGWKNFYMADTVKTIGNRAFYSCYDICTARLSKSLEEIGDEAFWNPSALTTLTLPSTLKNIGTQAFGAAFSLNVLTFEVPKKESDYHDLDIAENAFKRLAQNYDKNRTVNVVYTSEKAVLRDRNTGVEIAEGSKLKESDLSNRQLTWIKHTPTNYVITYDPNGGRLTGGITTVRVPVNSTINLHTREQLGLTYIGKDLQFMGWATDKDAKIAEYKDGGEFTATDDTTLYAVWKDGNQITFNPNGGSFADGESEKYMYIPFGGSANLTTAAKLGLTPSDDASFFVGWATSKESAASATIDYVDGAQCTPTDDMTLYAVWKIKPVITFDPNKESGGRFASGDEIIKEIIRPVR